ncbi:MAG: hypothetical protein UY63_C0001G0005 [Parcubacteria group bacterium GW2011_GWA2_51_10]|nr:MAG: hypothetical protein UY63_C0001G0005 [Parcubacteria group bacterium GW2011_GWA2_51_10]
MDMPNVKTSTLIIIAIILAALAWLLLQIPRTAQAPSANTTANIKNFDECAAAGYPIMESYPEQCRTPDGRTFVNERQINSDSTEDQNQVAFNGCAVAGCSGQLCVEASEAGDIVTTCEFRAEYACYREASCGRQLNGRCGWTETVELRQCLQNSPAVDGNIEVVF